MPQQMTFKAAVAALALIGLVSSALAAKKEEIKADVPADACGNRKMSKKVDKPLIEAQKALSLRIRSWRVTTASFPSAL